MNNDEDGARKKPTSADADRVLDDLLAEIDSPNTRSQYSRTPTSTDAADEAQGIAAPNLVLNPNDPVTLDDLQQNPTETFEEHYRNALDVAFGGPDPSPRPLPPTLDDRLKSAETYYNSLESPYVERRRNYEQNPNKDPQELNELRAEYIAKAEAEKIYFGLKAEQEPARADEYERHISDVQANIDTTRQEMLSARQAELTNPVAYEALPAQPENTYADISLEPAPNAMRASRNGPVTVETATPQAEPRTLSEKENREISDAIDKARGKTALTDKTLADGEKTLKEGIAKLSEKEYQNLKLQNTDFLKEAAQAALKGGSEVKNFLNKEVGKFNFVQDINKAVEHDGKKLETNQFKEVANAHERFSANKIDSEKVVDFVKQYQGLNLDKKGKKQEFPLKLITDVKNEGMVKLVTQDPETAAIGLQAFKDREGKGLNAFKAVDLGKGMEAAMASAAKHIDPEQKKLAVDNIANMVMNTAAGSRYELLSGKVKMDQDKLDAIKEGVKQDKIQENPTKSFGDVFRDKTGLGGAAGDKGKVVGPFGGLVTKSPVNLHPGDNAKATWETIKGLKTANPIKAAYNLVKLAVYNIPKLAVSALIATPIALVRTGIQVSKDKKNLRLQNVATLATKYPKVYKAIAQALQKDGKSKVHNKDILKAFNNLGDKAKTIENSTLSVKAIKDALSQKAGRANHMSEETKKNYVKKTDGQFNEPKVLEVANKKLDVGKGPTVLENLMRGGNATGATSVAVGGLTELLDKDAIGKLKQEYGSKVFAAVENVLKENGIEPSAKVMNKVLEGLGPQAAKSLEGSTVSQESIEKNLVRTMDRTPNTPKLIEALAKGGEISDQAAIAFNNLAVKATNNPNAVIDASRAPNPPPMPDRALTDAANALRQNNAVTTGGAATTPVPRSADNIATQRQADTQAR